LKLKKRLTSLGRKLLAKHAMLLLLVLGLPNICYFWKKKASLKAIETRYGS